MAKIEFSKDEWNFLIKEFSKMAEWNPCDEDIEKMLKIVNYAKINNIPELIFLWMYGYFESTVDPESKILEDYPFKERRIIKSIWEKLEKLKAVYGDPFSEDTMSRLGIDMKTVEKGLKQITIKKVKNKNKGKNKRRIEIFVETEKGAKMISEDAVSKNELVDKLRNLPNSVESKIYGIIAELSHTYIITKTQDRKWEIQLDELTNTEFNTEVNESEVVKIIEDIDELKKWIDEVF